MNRTDRLRRIVAAFAVSLVLGAVVTAGAGGATPTRLDVAAAPSPSGGGGEAVSVTLLTGDRVTVRTIAGRPMPHVDPGDGRDGVVFDARMVDGHIHVIPSDAVALLAAGRLDPRLFDVTELVASGYDDAHRADIPLIVEGDQQRAAGMASDGAETTPLPAAGAVAVAQPKDRTAELWAELTAAAATRDGGGVERVWLDGLRQPSLDVSVPQIGAPEAWAAGYTGVGVRVAVLDSGVDATHPDLAGRVVARRNFTDEPDDDLVGHGTHVASTVVGSGAASGGRYRGVAPDAGLLSGKVCWTWGCPDSAILAGMQWAVDTGARVVNLSLGGPDSPGTDPVEAAVDRLSAERGTLFVVAAGNEGPGDATVASPASADAALAVGSVDDRDQVARTSSRGPRLGDDALKPEVTAPGVDILAARARNAPVGEPGQSYVSASGTSMATPHVAGAAALVAQQHPDWTGAQLKASLVAAASPTPGTDVFAQGAGRIDVGRAVGQEVTAEPAVVSAGRALWPHQDDAPTTHALTYRNPGSAPVTLALTTETAGPDGQPAPEGMFKLDADQVVVPAGGESTVHVTVDTRISGPAGGYGAWVVATAAPGTVVTTPVAVEVEPESYELTIVHRDHDGELASLYGSVVLDLQGTGMRTPYEPDGSVTLRLPRGRYHAESTVYTPAGDDFLEALLVQPMVQLDRDTTVELDARQARPFEITLARADAVPQSASVSHWRDTEPGGRLYHWLFGFGEGFLRTVTTAQVGPAVAPETMLTELNTSWAVPDAEGGFLRSPRTYDLAWYERGRMMTGARHAVRDDQLATVRADLRATGPDRLGLRYPEPRPPGDFGLLASAGRVALPHRRVELYNVDGVQWATHLAEVRPVDPADPEGDVVDEVFLESLPVPRRAGRWSSTEQWNRAPLGPLVSRGRGTFQCSGTGQPSSRLGDVITVDVAVFADAAGHPGCADPVGVLDPPEARTTLLRDGVEVGSSPTAGSGEFTVPAGPATYRLEVDSSRAPGVALSTRVTGAWTFRSEHVPGAEAAPLPLMAVRFSPRLDRQGQAPGGQRFTVPLSVDVLGGAGGHLRRPAVEVSYDDGATWAPATVRACGHGTWAVELVHPAEGHVSLRAMVTDRAGNQVEQTILRAYRLA